MSFNFAFFDKIDILADTGQFWPKFWLRGTHPSLFWAITFEPIEIQTSTTHQNLEFFMLFHFAPKSFSVKLIIFMKNDQMRYLDQFCPIFDQK